MIYFFFFQAEDGIRDKLVTGVQTCALPICLGKPVVVRRDSRPTYRHSGGLLDGPIGFPKAHPSLPPGERAVRVRTETLPIRRGPFSTPRIRTPTRSSASAWTGPPARSRRPVT